LAHRFFVASMIALRPAALNLRFRGVSGVATFAVAGVSFDSRKAAYRRRWASAIFRLVAALNVRFRPDAAATPEGTGRGAVPNI
jgi:hypothetical protein